MPGRVTAFTFFSVTVPVKAAWFEEKIYRKVEEVEKVDEKGGKKNRGVTRSCTEFEPIPAGLVCGVFETNPFLSLSNQRVANSQAMRSAHCPSSAVIIELFQNFSFGTASLNLRAKPRFVPVRPGLPGRAAG
ncbi:MAG: hypothetical protein LBL44_01665 [Treponema sp.]|nr:hypothetical protein [Treponema sp.]